jgi:hypothetical protein
MWSGTNTHAVCKRHVFVLRKKKYNVINILEAARGLIDPSSNYDAEPNDHVLLIVLVASTRSSHYPQVGANTGHLHVIRAHN